MDFAIQTERFIQILHDTDRNHWVALTSVDSSEPEEVYGYGRLFSYSSPCLRAQAASLLHASKPKFTLRFVDLHKQDGHNDCGAFAVTYATALCLAKQPG